MDIPELSKETQQRPKRDLVKAQKRPSKGSKGTQQRPKESYYHGRAHLSFSMQRSLERSRRSITWLRCVSVCGRRRQYAGSKRTHSIVREHILHASGRVCMHYMAAVCISMHQERQKSPTCLKRDPRTLTSTAHYLPCKRNPRTLQWETSICSQYAGIYSQHVGICPRKTHELSSGTLVILPGMHKRQFRALFAQQKRPTNSLSRSRRFRVQAYARKSIYSRGKRNLVSPKRDLLTSNSPKRDLLTSNTQ